VPRGECRLLAAYRTQQFDGAQSEGGGRARGVVGIRGKA
jgi:hypothetical protein